jgi:hypothetical protein
MTTSDIVAKLWNLCNILKDGFAGGEMVVSDGHNA